MILGFASNRIKLIKNPGVDLLSRPVSRPVSWALVGLTAGFGMEAGCFPTAMDTRDLAIEQVSRTVGSKRPSQTGD